MKAIKIVMLGLALSVASSVAVAEVSFSNTVSRSTAYTDVDRTTTGNIDNREIKYSTQRQAQDLGDRNCGAHCSPTENRYAVESKFSVIDTNTKLNEKTGGLLKSDTTSCFSTLTVGNLSHAIGSRETTVVNDTTTQRNNVSTIKGFEVAVSTINDKGHVGSGIGDDVTVKSGNQVLFDTAGNFNTNVKVVDVKDVSVVGFNDGKGDYAGVNLNTTITDLTQADKSRVRNTTQSTTRSVFSEFN